jgi:hypothetical protein
MDCLFDLMVLRRVAQQICRRVSVASQRST